LTSSERLISVEDSEGWSAALEGVQHSFAFSWECCRAIQATNNLPTYLYCYEDEGARVVCPFSERMCDGLVDIYTPYGVSGFAANGRSPSFADAWRNFCRVRGYVCSYLALHPRFDEALHHEASHPGNPLYFLDVRLGADDLLRRMERGRRRSIKRWQTSGGTLSTDRDRLAAFLVRHYGSFMHRVGASAVNFLTPATLQMFCQSPQVEIMGAVEGNEVVAVHAYAHTRWDAESLLLLALPEGRTFMTALIWTAVEGCMARGIPSFNLGGGVQHDDAIAFSKKLWGGEQLPFRRLKEVYREPEYMKLCQAVGADPTDRSEYFPAYRAGSRFIVSAVEP